MLRLSPSDGALMDVVAARGELHGVAGLAFAPDGALYVSSYEDSRVVRFNVSEAGHGSTGGGVRRLKPWEAGRRHGHEDTLRQLAEEDEGDKEASRRQQQIERMLDKLKEGAEVGVQQARKGRKAKSSSSKASRTEEAGGGSRGDFEYPSAEVGKGSLDADRNHSAWMHADIADNGNVTMLQAANSSSPSA